MRVLADLIRRRDFAISTRSTGVLVAHPFGLDTVRAKRQKDIVNCGGQGNRPPEGTLGYCTCAQEAVSTKRRKKIGLSMA